MNLRFSRRGLLWLGAMGAAAEPLRGEEWAPECLLTWGQRGAAPGEFNPPIGIAISAGDLVHVTDFRNHRVQRFTTEGKLVDVIPVAPYPGGIAVDGEGRIYLAHFKVQPDQQDKITVYDAHAKPLREWGKTGAAPGELNMPGGIAVGRDGSIYVADETNHRVQRFTPEGRLVACWGSYGTGPGQFGGTDPVEVRTGGPQMLAVDGEGNVYTTEGGVCRIQKLSAEGRPLWQWVNASSGPGGFGGRPRNLPGPIAVCLDRDGCVWVSSTNHRVQQFTARGRYVRGFGRKGTQPGEFQTPHGLDFDSQGALYVVDTQNCRIQKFRV